MSYPNSISLAPHSQTTNFVKGAIEAASSASCGMATLPGARVYLVAPVGCPALSLSGPAPTAASAASPVMASVGAAEDGASVSPWPRAPSPAAWGQPRRLSARARGLGCQEGRRRTRPARAGSGTRRERGESAARAPSGLARPSLWSTPRPPPPHEAWRSPGSRRASRRLASPAGASP